MTARRVSADTRLVSEGRLTSAQLKRLVDEDFANGQVNSNMAEDFDPDEIPTRVSIGVVVVDEYIDGREVPLFYD